MGKTTVVNAIVVTHDELESILMPALKDGVGIMKNIVKDETEESKNKIGAFNSLLSLGRYIEVRKSSRVNKPKVDVSKYLVGGNNGDGRLLPSSTDTA